MKVIKSCVIAFSIYSKIPVPQFQWKEEDMEYMMCFFPWIGAVIGGIFYGWYRLADICQVGSLCTALLAAAIPLLVSGGFHLDGYMDTMDAFHSYQNREKKLEILKDSHIGAFSVIMVVVYYLLYVGAASELHSARQAAAAATGFFLSRCLSGIGVVSFSSAKKDGLLYTFASGAQKKRVKAALYLQLLLAGLLLLDISWKMGSAVLAAAFVCFFYYYWKSKKELGGITGDTAGWFVTICEAAICITAAVSGYLPFMQ